MLMKKAWARLHFVLVCFAVYLSYQEYVGLAVDDLVLAHSPANYLLKRWSIDDDIKYILYICDI